MSIAKKFSKRVIIVFATTCLILCLVLPLSAYGGEGAVLESETSSTHVTVKVLGAIKDTLKLGFSHDLEAEPVIAGSPETAWNFGTLTPDMDALGASEFPNAVTVIEGYDWVIDYQSNAAAQRSVECIGIGDCDISRLKPFFWLRTWTDPGFAEYSQPEPGYPISFAFAPSYDEVLGFPTGIKIDMKPETGDTGPDPWSVEAGRYEVEVASTWSILQQEGDPVPKAPAITLTRYVYLTVANVIGKELGFGIGASAVDAPEHGTYLDLGVDEDWIGAVYPWVLNYKSNSDFYMDIEIPPITLQGEVGNSDIRKHMKYYIWEGSGLDPTGTSMYPSAGGPFIERYIIPATFGGEISFPNRIELDLSGAKDGNNPDRWKVRAGIYRPTQDISVGYSCELQDRTITAHVFTIDPLEFQVAVPERQDGYELPETAEFEPVDGVVPGASARYEYELICNQNHDRNVVLSWMWSDEKAGAGEISWNIFNRSNVEEGTTEEGQLWKGRFKYNPDGNSSVLGYSIRYKPSWTDPPGEKELIIMMSHSPAV